MIRPIPNHPEHVLDVPITSPSDGHNKPSKEGKKMAFLALSHTAVEHRIYLVMLDGVRAEKQDVGVFGIRRLMVLTGLSSYSSIRRGCIGLIKKLSIEAVGNGDFQQRSLYRVYGPDEIFARRCAAGINPYPKEIRNYESSIMLDLVIEGIIERHELSRREAFVALCCIEGLSNAEIGKKLSISEKTVKYHMRHIFIKFGVKRRTELVGCLIKQRNSKEEEIIW